MKLSAFIYCLLFYNYACAQTGEKEPEHELAIGIKFVTGKIIFGENEFYITDPGGVGIEPACFRYDHPVKISGTKPRIRYISLSAQAGFLFFKAKDYDSLYFHPKNPSYFTISAGIYTANSFSVGAEFFFWKGLGNRDLFGAKFLSAGYNGKNFRLYASCEYYLQLSNTRNNGTVFSIDFFWKLIRGGAERTPR